jgi:L-alanine-DL-glutamate epimerase-like enolase superfamily enzyme
VTPTGPQVDALSSAEISVKLFVEDASAVDLEELIPVFHRWIREDVLEDELPIDVAGYAHVPKGPGVVMICDHAHYYFDERAGRAGLRYRGRRVARGAGEEGIARAFRSLLRVASLLEKEPALGGRYRFRTDQIEFGISDRLRAPSDEETLSAVRPALDSAVKALYGKSPKSVVLASGPREPFMVSIETGSSPSVDALLEQLAAAAR